MSSGSYDVLLGDVPVGRIGPSSEGRIAFRFNDVYRKLPSSERPVLGQRFEDDLERVYAGRRAGELPAFFAHLLPAGRLRGVLERSLGLEGASDLDLLGAVGDDLPGAVRIVAAEGTTEALDGAADEGGEAPPDSGVGLRFSLAGVQLKFSLLAREDRFTVPAHDELGDWIVKLPLGDYPGLAENERAVMTWARAARFDVPPVRLVDLESLGDLGRYAPEGTKAYAVRRFDRERGRRIHQEDMAQVFGRRPLSDGSEKYASTHETLGVIFAAVLGEEAKVEYLRRLVFVIASGNNDAHLKNWSIVYPDGITPRPSPLYDQVSTVAWPRLDRRLGLKLASNRELARITRDHLRRLARHIDLDDDAASSVVGDTLADLQRAWPDIAPLLPADHARRVAEHWKRTPLLRAAGQLA